MKMKHKLRVGFGLLFLAVIFFGFLSLFFLKRLSDNSKLILQDNYESLKYVREMRKLLDLNPVPLSQAAYQRFDRILKSEEKNITEPGEQTIVGSLRGSFERMSDPTKPANQQVQARREVMLNIGRLADINLAAIVKKSQKLQSSVDEATGFLSLLTALTFLILFSLIFNLVGFFEEPFKELIDGFKDISHRKHLYKIHYDRQDELGDVFSAYNEMVVHLDRYHKSLEEKEILEKLKAEAVIKRASDPIIVLNDRQQVIDVNLAAEKLLKVDKTKMVGKNVAGIADADALISEIAVVKKCGETIKIDNDTFELDKETIVIPSETISGMQESEITVVGKIAQELIILKKNR